MRLSLIVMGRHTKAEENSVDQEITDAVRMQPHGITYKNLWRLLEKRKCKFNRSTFARHVKILCEVKALDHKGKLYFFSDWWGPYHAKNRLHEPIHLSHLNLYVELLESITIMSQHYLDLLQIMLTASDISKARTMAKFRLNQTVDSQTVVNLVRRIWESKGTAPLESLIGRNLTLQFMKYPPTGKIIVEGKSDR